MRRALSGAFAVLVVLALATTAIASADDTVIMADNPSFGTILTAPNGMTLYTWAADVDGVSTCYDNCAVAWPPLLAMDGMIEAPAGLPGSLGLVERADGTWQVTYEGWPLYFFVRDTAPGEVNGHGSMGFGALWSVVSVTPRTIALDAPAMPGAQPAAAPRVAQPAPARSAAVAGAQATPVPTATPTPTPTPRNGQVLDVTMLDFDYMPRTITVAIGDSVRWTNRGRERHTATDTSDTRRFDSGTVDGGQSWTSPPFTTVGSYPYYCVIHPWMRGTIAVSATGERSSVDTAAPAQPPYGEPMGYGMDRPGYGMERYRYGFGLDRYRSGPLIRSGWGYAGYPYYTYYRTGGYGYGYLSYAGYGGYYPWYGGYTGYGFPWYGGGYGGFSYAPYGIYGYPWYGGYAGFGYPWYGGYYGYPWYGGFSNGLGYPYYGYPLILKDEQAPVAQDPTSITLTAASVGGAAGAALAMLNPAAETGALAQVLPGQATVSMFDNFFSPPTITIPIGGTIRWTNLGNAPHTATSDPGAITTFDSGIVQRGASYTSPAFNTAGTIPYHCTLHPEVRGTIVVVSSTTGSPFYGYPYYGFGYGFGYPYYYSQYSGYYNYPTADPYYLYGSYAYNYPYSYYGYGYGYPYSGYGYGYGYPYSGYGYGYPYSGYGYGYGYGMPYGPYYWTLLY